MNYHLDTRQFDKATSDELKSKADQWQKKKVEESKQEIKKQTKQEKSQ